MPSCANLALGIQTVKALEKYSVIINLYRMKERYAISFKKDLKPLWELGIVVDIFGGGLLAVAYVI